MIQLTTKIYYEPERLILELPTTADLIAKEFAAKLHGGPAVVQLKKWYHTRSTGWKSQNHHINGHVAQIARATGNDFDTVKTYCKTEALASGYPFDTIKDYVVPWSETRLDVLQASILIDTIHRIAAEENIILIEEEF
jgi:hypothetical protein